jgi:hypothetical protein
VATEEEVQAFQDYLDEKSEEFRQLRQNRHEAGAKEYGTLTFLGNDVVRMMIEELADTANYCEMQAIKLLILQEQIETTVIGTALTDGQPGDEIRMELGAQAFRGTKDGWKRS